MHPLEILLDPVSLVILAIYGSLMLWEALAPGSYQNETGFYDGASARIKEMLLFKKVDQPKEIRKGA